MELNDYQEKAMSTMMESCDNMGYAVTGLNAEVGEINDKLAKWIRKGYIKVHYEWDKSVSTEMQKELIKELTKEVGDVQWFVSHMAMQLGTSLDNVAQQNLSKLADRKNRGVIDGNGDNR